MFNDPEIRKGLLIALIASILFVLLVQPVMNLAGSAIISVSGLVSQRLSDLIYRRAARGFDYSTPTFMVMTGAGALVGLGVGYFSVLWRTRPRLPESTPRESPRVPRRRRRARAVLGGGCVLAGLVSTFVGASDLLNTRLNLDFQQRLAILNPVLDDSEHKQILAAWASMRSRANYDAINKQLEDSARAHGVGFLPKPR
jgi:hypothetical protein